MQDGALNEFWLIIDESYSKDEYDALVSRCKRWLRLAEWAPFLRGNTTVRPS